MNVSLSCSHICLSADLKSCGVKVDLGVGGHQKQNYKLVVTVSFFKFSTCLTTLKWPTSSYWISNENTVHMMCHLIFPPTLSLPWGLCCPRGSARPPRVSRLHVHWSGHHLRTCGSSGGQKRLHYPDPHPHNAQWWWEQLHQSANSFLSANWAPY